jgi:uridine kinase
MTVISKQENSLQIATERILSEAQKKAPVVIAVDGGSGAGKSIFAKHLAEQTNAVVIPLDDFYSADIPNKKWDEYTTKEKLNRVFQWERLMTTAIKPLLKGDKASWTTYDFLSIQKDGTYKQKLDLQKLPPSNIIIIDGTYSASPSIIDFIDITILIL